MTQGYASAVGIEAATPISKGFEVRSCTLAKKAQIIDASGIRGSRSHRSERTRAGNYDVAGTIVFEPSPEDLALLLPWILGANASGTTFALAETLQTRRIVVDKGAKVYTYEGCVVSKAVFSGSEGQAMQLSVDVVGTTETEGNSGTLPSLTYTNTNPFMFAESVLTLVSASRNCKDWSVSIDNQLEVSFYNSQTATRIEPKDRMVEFSANVPFTSSETDLYGQALLGSAATLVLAPSNYSLTFTFGKLQFPAEGVVIQGKQELLLALNGVARMTSTTPELAITLDSTP